MRPPGSIPRWRGLCAVWEPARVRQGRGLVAARDEKVDEAAADAYIAQREFSISIQLHQGAGSCVFWTTDLTHEYIHINADYST